MQDLLESLTRIKIVPKFYRDLPESAGVYLYLKNKVPIYVGKAINLRRRVASYFDFNLGSKTAKMIGEADSLSYIKVDSELETLLLEARLIKKYMPYYNVQAKDDKHPLYIQITKEEFPRIITVRKVDLYKNPALAVYGPFPSSSNVRLVLRMIRRIFPYSDHKIGKRACLYSHIGLCNPCPSEILNTKDVGLRIELETRYRKNIRNIRAILGGKISKVRTDLIKEMDALSVNRKFENAAVIRDQVARLEYITRPQIPSDFYIQNPNLLSDIRKKEVADLKKILQIYFPGLESVNRVECYDIAHLYGVNPTASMVTFINGEPEKRYYRHFRIRQKKGSDDYASMKEVIDRRRKHFDDWGRPDLIIVDGGKGQVSVFLRELENESIPIIGLAKRFETLVIPSNFEQTLVFKDYRLPKGFILNFVQRVRDEAHRFARVYHHKLVQKDLIKS